MNTKWKFVSLTEGVLPVESETFEGAFRAMYAHVKKLIESDTVMCQVLETTFWIESPSSLPIFFYDARDMACDSGLMDKLEAEAASCRCCIQPGKSST